MRAMVLAAGWGTRLRPLTNLRPKCLMPAADRTLLGLWLERLAGWGVERAVVNTHHLAEPVRARLARGWPGLEVVESFEPELLGTGGGLVAARAALGPEPFLLVNADVLATSELPPLVQTLERSGAVAVLGLKDEPRFNTVALDPAGQVRGFQGDPASPPASPPVPPGQVRWRTYTGLAAVHPRLLSFLPPAGPSSLVQGLRAALAAGEVVLGVELDGFWDDLGTPERLLVLHRDLALGRRPELAGLAPSGPVWLGPGARAAKGARLEGFVFAGAGARVEAGAVVRDSLLLPGAVVRSGARVEQAVLGDGYLAAGQIEGGAHA